MTISLVEVDLLTDALSEAWCDGTWDHWNEGALERLRALDSRMHKYWNAQSRSVREAAHDEAGAG